MFGREGRKEKKQREAHNAAYEAARKEANEAFEIGLKESMEAFSQVYEQHKGFGGEANNLLVNSLLEGATQAFLEEGHPEKIQHVLSDRDMSHHRFKAAKVLLPLTRDKDSEQAIANIKLALDKLPEDKKQAVLDSALYSHIASGKAKETYEPYRKTFDKNDEAFIDVLLKAGANANGNEGRIFAEAITYHSSALVKQLRANGADFKDALLIMQVEPWGTYYTSREDCIAKLNAYQGHENGNTVEQLQQNISDLTERLAVTEARLDELQPERKPASATPLKKLRLNTPSP